MVKRIAVVAGRSFTCGMRGFMAVFILLMPFALGLALKAIIPGASSATIRVALVAGADTSLEGYLDGFLTVERLPDRRSVERRVLRIDEAFGLVAVDGGYELIRQGNEREGAAELLSFLLASRSKELGEMNSPGARSLPITLTVSSEDRGWALSPVKLEGSSFLLVFCTMFGGMLIALGIMEEKTANTIAAMNVSPVTRPEYIVGMSLLGFLVPLLGSLGIVAIVGFPGVDWPMLALIVFCTSFISVIVGFGIGIVAKDELSTIASMKTMFLPVFGSVLGGMFLPGKWQPVLYWSPYYWAYAGVRSVLLGEASWGRIAAHAGIILGISALVFTLMGRRIRRGLR